MLRVLLATIFARVMQWKESFWPSRGEVVSAAGHNIGARYAIEFFFFSTILGDVATAAGHDIGAKERFWPISGDVVRVAIQ